MNKRLEMVFTASLCALIMLMSAFPFLGYIPLGIMNATLIQIPVIVGGILLGKRKGCFLGIIFGISSLWKNTTAPNLTSFVFSPFVPIPGRAEAIGMLPGRIAKCFWICIVSRMMIGLAAAWLYGILSEKTALSVRTRCLLCGAAGSLTNTVLVGSGILLFYGEAYKGVQARAGVLLSELAAGLILTQGIPEALISALVTAAVAGALMKSLHKI